MLRSNSKQSGESIIHVVSHTHTHTCLTVLFPGLSGWASTRKVKPIWILLKQETVSGSGISWHICKSAPCSRQITTPAPHHSVFLQAGCPSCRPTNSVKALKATYSVMKKKRKGCGGKDLQKRKVLSLEWKSEWVTENVGNVQEFVSTRSIGQGTAASRLRASCSHPCAPIAKQYNF